MHKHRLCFTLRTKNPNTSPIGKKFGFCCCGAPPGTRTLGPLIKRNQRATIANFDNHADSSFSSFYREFTFCICCILCTCYPLLHPLSSRSGVQKVCKNVQSQNQPLKQVSDFYAKPGKWPGLSPKRQLRYHLFRLRIKCTSTTTIHGRDLDDRTDATLLAGTLWKHSVPIIFSKNFKKGLGCTVRAALCFRHRR